MNVLLACSIVALITPQFALLRLNYFGLLSVSALVMFVTGRVFKAESPPVALEVAAIVVNLAVTVVMWRIVRRDRVERWSR